MRFTSPEFLWLTPVALAVAWWWARRPRAAIRFSDIGFFDGPRGGRAWRAVWGGAALRGVACLALVLACAGPRRPDEQTRLPAEAIAIMMVVDVSGSMNTKVAWAAGEPAITRLEAAQRAFKLFVFGGDAPDGSKFEPRPSDQIGLVSFAAIPEVACPLTLNHSSGLLKKLEELKPKGGPDAGTNVGDAIALATIHLDSAAGAKRKLIILLSDGEHVQSKEGKDAELRPGTAAQLAANLKFPIYAIDAGGDLPPSTGEEELRTREEGRQTLRDVAQRTSGKYFAANDGSGLLAACKEIEALERTPVETYQYRRYYEYYAWLAGAAVVLLLSAHVLDRTLWRVVP
jgi:Ca-activated chloride channel homolog